MRSTRRTLITAGALNALGWLPRGRAPAGLSALGCAADFTREETQHVLVTIFLRGGADGLSLVPPIAEDDYYRLRPTLAIPGPGDLRASSANRAARLTDQFGLHPSLAPLRPLWEAGELAIVHACGSSDHTRSHFEAMATMERGLADQTAGGVPSGWLARHLMALDQHGGASVSPLRAVAIGGVLPQSLAGASGVTVMRDVRELALPADRHNREIERAMRVLYASPASGILSSPGLDSLALLQRLERLNLNIPTQNGASYPKGDLGDGLRQVARLVRLRVGVQVACLDQMGYDTHVAQGGASGLLAAQLSDLAHGLTALRLDLGSSLWARTTVVVLSEFGRRVEENSGLGTDHGRGGAMLVMGGSGIRGGRVYGRWPTLRPDRLDGPGDLQVTSDYRNVLAEVLRNRCGQSAAPSDVFPGLRFESLGITNA